MNDRRDATHSPLSEARDALLSATGAFEALKTLGADAYLPGFKHTLAKVEAAIKRLEETPSETRVPEGWRMVKDSTFAERAWKEDQGHENGNYHCTCIDCGRLFQGHKRRVLCRVCADVPCVHGEATLSATRELYPAMAKPDDKHSTPRTDAHLAHLNLPDGRKVGIPNETVALLRQLERELAEAYRLAVNPAAALAKLEATPSAKLPKYWQVGWARIEQRASGAIVIGSVSDEQTEHHNQPVYVEVKIGAITVRDEYVHSSEAKNG